MASCLRDDLCDRCGARLDSCTCVVRRLLEDAPGQALGRGERDRPPGTPLGDLRERASILVRDVQDSMRLHTGRCAECAHCVRCPRLFCDLLVAERAAIDIASSLDRFDGLMGHATSMAADSITDSATCLVAATRGCSLAGGSGS